MKAQNRNIGGRVGRVVSRSALVFGASAAGAIGFGLPGVGTYEALGLAAIFSLAAVVSLALFTRAQARERWEAAWDAYAERELSSVSRRPADEERALSLGATR
jgi:hypothetical protein